MAFQLSCFDVVKQHYDGSGIFHYHDTVDSTKADPTSGRKGDTVATIAADGFFNPVIDQLGLGSVIIISTIAGCGVYVVTGLTGTETVGEGTAATTVTVPKVKLTKAS